MPDRTLTLREAENQIDELLGCPQQMWLLGAGISCEAGVPLMKPLTSQVGKRLQASSTEHLHECFEALHQELADLEDLHVEHILSHLGDLISLSRRSRKEIPIGAKGYAAGALEELHQAIQVAICEIVRWGHKPGWESKDGSPGQAERTGTKDEPIICIEQHRAFVTELYRRRNNRERLPPIHFFTTNYDTLLEDALSLCRIRCDDGFHGGAMAFWAPDGAPPDDAVGARLSKLHGSIDWFLSKGDVVIRRRDGASYPIDRNENLLIYPQSTKYRVTQRDPFARLFSRFREALTGPGERVLFVCGYSFGDEHINEEIRRALEPRGSALTVVAFVREEGKNGGLCTALQDWLDSRDDWPKRLILATDKGFYHGKRDPLLALGRKKDQGPLDWWRFDKLTGLLSSGPKA